MALQREGQACARPGSSPRGSALQGNTGKGKDRGAVALQQAYLRVVGLEEDLQGSHSLPTFT